MGVFNGEGERVRCIDCTECSNSFCNAKDSRVAVKKHRRCAKYKFKGAYENRVPSEAMYLPHVGKKARRQLNKLLRMGIAQVSDPNARSGLKSFDMPTSTASATPSTSERKLNDSL